MRVYLLDQISLRKPSGQELSHYTIQSIAMRSNPDTNPKRKEERGGEKTTNMETSDVFPDA